MFSATPTIVALIQVVSKGDSGLARFTPAELTAFVPVYAAYVNDAMGDLGLALAVCHELALQLRQSGGAVGPLTEKREGMLQRAYAAPQGVPAYFATSPYGLRFYELVQRTICAVWSRQVGYAEGLPSALDGGGGMGFGGYDYDE